MAGLGSFNGDVGRFQIADFAHHDNVGILAQKGAQGRSKGEPLFVVDVYLVDAGQVDLSRVFRGGDVHVFRVENIQAGIEGNGFARAGGAGDQHHAVGAVDGFQQQFFLKRLKAQLLDIERARI